MRKKCAARYASSRLELPGMGIDRSFQGRLNSGRIGVEASQSRHSDCLPNLAGASRLGRWPGAAKRRSGRRASGV